MRVVAGDLLLMAATSESGGNLTFNLDAFLVPLIPLRTTQAQEVIPSADADHLAWSQATRRRPSLAALPAIPGQPRTRVNPVGHGRLLRRIRRRQVRVSGSSSPPEVEPLPVRPRRRRRSAPLAGVNTPHWEWHPTISGEWLLFGRRKANDRIDLVLLRNLVTGETREIGRLRWERHTVAGHGQVRGNYAVWFRCTPACDVFLHDIAADTSTQVPESRPAPAVRPFRDERRDRVLRTQRPWHLGAARPPTRFGGPSKVVASLGAGRDSFHT